MANRSRTRGFWVSFPDVFFLHPLDMLDPSHTQCYYMLLQPATAELIPSTTFSGAHLIKLGPFTVGIRAGRSEGLVLVS